MTEGVPAAGCDDLVQVGRPSVAAETLVWQLPLTILACSPVTVPVKVLSASLDIADRR